MRYVTFFALLLLVIFTSSNATIIHVPGTQPNIQAGINSASNGDTVLVDDSTYIENINYNGKAITVASNFMMNGDTNHINNTIIDGSQPNHPDSGSVVYFISGEDTTSILCGFTITGGTGTRYLQYGGRVGGGIVCTFSGGRITSNIIRNNTVNDHSLFTFGGGVGAGPSGSDLYLILENNKIIENQSNCTGNFAGGGGVGVACNGRLIENDISYNQCTSTYIEANGGGVKITAESSSQPRFVIVKDNQITHNIAKGKKASIHHGAKGAGIVIHFSKVLILENNISHNQLDVFENSDAYGAGISISSISGPAYDSQINNNSIIHNSITDNITSGGGGIRLRYSTISISNNIISENSAKNGGGIYLERSSESEAINNTVVKNTAISYGGGLFSTTASSAFILNSIFWDNQASHGPQINGGATVYYSDIQGGWIGTGTNNIDIDPQFADTVNFQLSDTSPCIGAGIDSIEINNVWYACPCSCYLGNPRPSPSGSNPDIGACESPLAVSGLEQSFDNISLRFLLSQNYPNPFNPTTTIEFDLPKSSKVTLKIFNILGEEVATLVSDRLSAGSYSYEWDASNLASGVYLYRLQAGDYVETRKMVLMR